MSEQEKKPQRIYYKKCFEITGVSLWSPSSQNLNTLHNALWGVLENKINPTPNPNIDSFKNAFEMEWNKMSEEFTLKACKSFRRRVDTIKKNGGYVQ